MALPTTFRIPFFSVEFSAVRASQGPSILAYRTLLIGGRLTAGTVAQLVLTKVTSEAQARTFFGEGSELHLMVRSFLLNNKVVELYCMALDDNGSGVAATKTLTVTGPATAAGTGYVYIGGVRIPFVIGSTDTANTVAATIRAAILAQADLPVTSAVTTNVVTLTAKNKGEAGQDIDVRVNYGEGEVFPTGISVAVADGTAGATNPLLSAAITALGDEWFQIIAAPYGDATNLSAIETELSDRFGNTRMIPGQYIFAKDGNLATMQTFGDARNSPHVQCWDFYGLPWTPFEYAAAIAALESLSAQDDPARPLFRQTIRGIGAKPPKVSERRTSTELNALLFDGISVFGLTPGSGIQILRAITMYQRNDAGAVDDAYLRAETMFTLMYLRYSFRNWFLTRYPRAKLADDGAFIPSGQSIITPSIAKGEAVAWARAMEQLGLVENIEQFKNDCVVTRNTQDKDRLDFVIAPDTINQFVVGAAIAQFIL